jgi:hypothetical protein
VVKQLTASTVYARFQEILAEMYGMSYEDLLADSKDLSLATIDASFRDKIVADAMRRRNA